MSDSIQETEPTPEALAMEEMAKEIVTLRQELRSLKPTTDASVGGAEPKTLKQELDGLSYNQIVKLASKW